LRPWRNTFSGLATNLGRPAQAEQEDVLALDIRQHEGTGDPVEHVVRGRPLAPVRAMCTMLGAGVIGRRLNVPVVAKSREEAADHFGWFAPFAGMDVPTSSERTRVLLGWEPKQPGLIADIDQPGYFKI
jgi:hypothetical protein